MKKILLALTILASAVAVVGRTAADFFVSAPSARIFYIDSITRMDMLDYYHSHSPQPSAALLGAPTRIVDESDGRLVVDLDSLVQYQLAVMTTGNDTVLALVETLTSTIPTSSVTFYDTSWRPLQRSLAPEFALADWLTAAGMANRDEVENMLPFLAYTIAIDPQARTLTYTNSMQPYFVADDWAMLSPWLKPQLVYTFTPKKITLKK